MSIVVVGKIKSKHLDVLKIKCGLCGVMFDADSFEDVALCPECRKKWRKK